MNHLPNHNRRIQAPKTLWVAIDVGTTQTCAKVPKRSEILGSLSPRSGALMDLGPSTSFLSWDSGNPGPKIVICRKTLETQDLKILICSKTLETQDLKILIVARPWKPRTLKLGYVAEPWKPRTQNLKMLMSRAFKVLGPCTIQCIISCWALCQGVQQVMNSDDRTPKTWIVKNNTTYRTHPAGGRL